ncbi:hypothetical protein E5288_WYG003333 [Bos mutus]|uniref:Uncharacterized protein n=1 Tax=Bos mutus TaxID=72004 RepID=A0A6B0RIG3_9CETA|nr:hypothetical protein [Bos mutus]
MAPSAVKLLMENFWRESRVLPSKLECERNLLEGDDRNEVKQLFPDPRASPFSNSHTSDVQYIHSPQPFSDGS